MPNKDTVVYNLNLTNINKEHIKDEVEYSYKNELWNSLTSVLSFFGVESSENRFFIKWPEEDTLQMTFLLKLLVKLIQGNILATYNNQNKTWTLLFR